MVAKVGLGLVGLSAISVGGVALTNPAWLGMDHMPNFHTLSEDKDFSTNTTDYGNETFGKKYGRYLVGVNSKTVTGNESEKTNEDWWKWAYRRLSRATTKPKKFEKVGRGYGTEENKHLSQACKAAYKLADSNGFGSNSSEEQFVKADVWKYCSPGELVGVSTDNYPDSQIGGGSDKATLVSVKNSANDWFWKIRNEDFWTVTNSEWASSKATSSDSASVFKTAHDGKTTAGATRKTIKELCGNAYEKPTNNSSDVKDAKRFCALELPANS